MSDQCRGISRRLVGAALLAVTCLATAATQPQSEQLTGGPGTLNLTQAHTIAVKCAGGHHIKGHDISGILAAVGGTETFSFKRIPWHYIHIPADFATAKAALTGLDGVAQVYENQPIDASQFTPNDPLYTPNTSSWDTWGLKAIHMPEAWGIVSAQGGTPVLVGVQDDSPWAGHPDLAQNIWFNPGEIAGDSIDNDGNGYIDDTQGWNFALNSNSYTDYDGHATHVSGTIAEVTNNAVGYAGIAGLASNVKIVSLAIFYYYRNGPIGCSGCCKHDSPILGPAVAVEYAEDMGVSIISGSWNGRGTVKDTSSPLHDIMEISPILFVHSAGNYGDHNIDDGAIAGDPIAVETTPCMYPFDNIICVGSGGYINGSVGMQPVQSSDYGPVSVDLVAPGDHILSTYVPLGYSCFCPTCDMYNIYNGTSMATPHVAGVAALIKALHPTYTARQIRYVILNSVDKTPFFASTGLYPTVTGGTLNAYKALTFPSFEKLGKRQGRPVLRIDD